jgi:hypothetical protein
MMARLGLVVLGACVALSSAASSAESPEPPPDGAGKAVTDTVKKLVEKAKEAPPQALGERGDRAAQAASRYIKALPTSLAIAATLVGFALLLFGRKLFRIGIVLYMMALVGFAGSGVGAAFEGAWSPLIGGLVGCVVGAAMAIPLRTAVRFIIGALAGAILVFVITQTFTSSLLVTVLATAGGLLVSGFLTFIFPTPLLIVGFSMFGAALASVGILSVATEPVDGHLVYRAAHVGGVVLAAMLGGLFQSQFEVSDEDET